MSQDHGASARRLAPEQLDELVAKFGRCRVAQDAHDRLMRISNISDAGKRHIHRGITKIQTGCYDPKVRPMTFVEMVQLGQGVIPTKISKANLEKLLYIAVASLHANATNKLERLVAVS